MRMLRAFATRRLRGGLPLQECLPEGLKQSAVYRVALRVVLCMPLNAQGKALCAGDTDCLDGSIFRNTFNNDPLAGLENTLAVETIDADRLPAKQTRKHAAWNELDIVAVGVNDGGIRMDLAILQPRHPMV